MARIGLGAIIALMGERVIPSAQLRAELQRREREAELRKQRQARRLNRAVMTLGIYAELEATIDSSGQAEYFTKIEQQGLPQRKQEGSDELRKRAAGICRADGLSAFDVAEAYASTKGFLDDEEAFTRRISVSIAEIYKSISEAD